MEPELTVEDFRARVFALISGGCATLGHPFGGKLWLDSLVSPGLLIAVVPLRGRQPNIGTINLTPKKGGRHRSGFPTYHAAHGSQVEVRP